MNINLDKFVATAVCEIFRRANEIALYQNDVRKGWTRGVLLQLEYTKLARKLFRLSCQEAERLLDGWRNPFCRKYYPNRRIRYWSTTFTKVGVRPSSHCKHDAVVFYD